MPAPQALPVVVLISGNGSNLQALIDAVAAGTLSADIRAVISNRPDAFGLERARRAGIPAIVVDHTAYADRAQFDQALAATIGRFAPALVVLAGFMRLLTPALVGHYHGRMLNIHPSLLPKFQGLKTHRRVLEQGETRHGATAHFVTAELDGGPRIAQVVVPVLQDDTAETLGARVLAQEHILYPQVIQWFAEGRLKMESSQTWFDNTPLAQPLLIDGSAAL